MVGHGEAYHHIAAREQQSGEQCAVKAVQLDDFPQDAVEEYETVNAAEDKNGGTDELHTINAEDGRQSLVKQIERPYKESQQRVAIDIIACLPVCDDGVSNGIEARYLEMPDEELPAVSADRHKLIRVSPHHKTIQQHRE